MSGPASVAAMPPSPFTSYIAFNARQNCADGSYPAVPRQFQRLEADWYLPFWDVNAYNATAIYDLYESVLPLFADMPAGLARSGASPSGSPSTVPAAPMANGPTATPSGRLPPLATSLSCSTL